MSGGRDLSSSIVVFDIGQVLVGFDAVRTIEYLSFYTSKSLDKKTYFPQDIIRNYETGGISDEEFHKEMSRALSLKCSFNEFFIGWNRMFTHAVEGIEDLLATLSKRYQLMALSNTSPSHIEYLTQRFDFFQVFSHIITSYELRLLKPDSLIYKKAEEEYFPGQKPLVYIDDLPENVIGAGKAGWSAYKFEGMEKLRTFLKSKSIL